MKSYSEFKKRPTVLFATDVASRGLDFEAVDFIVNFDFPSEESKYIHRVGRTARAERHGACISFLNDEELARYKKMSRNWGKKVLVRKVDFSKVKGLVDKVKQREGKVKKTLRMEYAEIELRKAEMEATKAQNMMNFSEEIYNKPKREWIVSQKQKSLLRKGAQDALDN